MPFVFSYGTLQQESVQRSLFGRPLNGRRDELVGFTPSLVTIENPRFVAASGTAQHANVLYTGGRDSRVPGTVFEVSDAELSAIDRYEQPASYTRVATTLASGKDAWVYVHACPEAR